ncbi:hypothetical protein ACFLX9_01015 [Chloroflexota bacterium]
MAEREQETRPTLRVACEEDLPIRMVPGEEREVRFRVSVARGGAARGVAVSIYVAPGLSIIEPQSEMVEDRVGVFYPSWITAGILDERTINPGMLLYHSATIQAPQEPGTYGIGYTITSEQYVYTTYHNRQAEFLVEVVAAQPVLPPS